MDGAVQSIKAPDFLKYLATAAVKKGFADAGQAPGNPFGGKQAQSREALNGMTIEILHQITISNWQ